MKVHEYQAKALLSQFGIPVPQGSVAATPHEAREAASALDGKVVVKAQVHAGGRGKAGGVKVLGSAQEAEQFAGELLGKTLVTFQTGPGGVPVNQVLVEETVDVARELYLAIVVDGESKRNVIIASEAGGMEIEEVAAATPEKILRVAIDPTVGYQPFQGRALAYGLGLEAAQVRPAADLIGNLYKLFVEKDCSMAEINPLVVTGEGRLIAVDAKLNIDDDSLFRHGDLRDLRDAKQEEDLEAEANDYDISYVKLDGDVGCLVNGAGLAMATMDIIQGVGAYPANFLDVGGGADVEKCKRAVSIILSDPKVKRILINIFGGILACDTAAEGVVAACKERGANPQMVVRMLGSNAAEGRQILLDSGLNVTMVDTLTGAAEALTAAA
jgi:succinyl-CoA synthetase beta subunit